jgi:heat shock protein HslJ
MKNLILIGLGILLLAMMSCKSNQIPGLQKNTEEKIIWVNSSKQPCTGVGPMNCLQVQYREQIEEGDWQNFYNEIEGFNYQPGNIYQIKVRIEKLTEPIPTDASSLAYSLLEVISQEPDRTLRLTDIWKVIEMGEIKNPMAREKALTMEINVSGRRVFGFSGCNTFRGGIAKITENELIFGNLASTMMACGDQENRLERLMGELLSATKSYKIENRNLSLMDGEGRILIVLLKVD